MRRSAPWTLNQVCGCWIRFLDVESGFGTWGTRLQGLSGRFFAHASPYIHLSLSHATRNTSPTTRRSCSQVPAHVFWLADSALFSACL